MIADLIARVERIQENASLKDDHGQSKCQEFQLIQVFGTDRGSGQCRVKYCDTPETERREQTGNTKQTYTLNETSLLDHNPLYKIRVL